MATALRETVAPPASQSEEADSLDRVVDDALAGAADAPAAPSAAAAWHAALAKVVPCVVVLKITHPRAFDTEPAVSTYATGFIVDAARGVILTNRHVHFPGPVSGAEAVLLNREEIAITALYADPIHDFAFFTFDPASIQFMEVGEIPLAPDGARVGLDIRVVGNDSGEKVSILAGTLARLDRDAPAYGKRNYNDFNTYYIQAASGTKGGSSGSPVVDVHGRAVALNAGGKVKAASAYYLPLHRVVRALDALRAGHDAAGGWAGARLTVPRGDLQTVFVYKGFDECRRLGLAQAAEAALRAAAAGPGGGGAAADAASRGTGALVVADVIPGGPADGSLEPGDVLLSVDGAEIVHFLPLEAALDDAVGRSVDIRVDRGGRETTVAVPVQDLHAVTPAACLEVGGAILHPLSYQVARAQRARTGLLYVADPGHTLGRAGVPRGAVVTSLAHTPTPTAAAFAAALAAHPPGARVPVEFYTFDDRGRPRVTLATVDAGWFGPPTFWERDAVAGGTWHALKDAPASLGGGVEVEVVAKKEGSGVVDAAAADSHDDDASTSSHSSPRSWLASIDVDVPVVALADGVHARSFSGAAVIVAVNPARGYGLALVDRNTVPIAPCDARLALGAYPADVAAHPAFLHPLHNFALVAFDTSTLPRAALKALRAAPLDPAPLPPGARLTLAGLASDGSVVSRAVTVVHPASPLSIAPADVPRFRAVHEVTIRLEHDYGSFAGALVTTGDDATTSGKVAGLWASFSEQRDREDSEFCAGLPAAAFARWVDAVVATFEAGPHPGPPPKVPVLDAEFAPLPLARAARYGVPSAWIARLAAAGGDRRTALRVRATLAGSPAAAALTAGDVLLAVGGEAVVDFPGLEKAVAAAGAAPLALTIARGATVLDVSLAPALEPGLATTRIVHWCGAQVQAPHRALRELGHAPPAGGTGVYVSRWHHGSPAHRYSLFALNWVASINGVPTPDVDAFLAAVAKIPHRAAVRVGLVHVETTKPKVLTLKQDLVYWPTVVLERPAGASPLAPAGGWTRTVVASAK